jgi:hypothetical protein
MRVRRSHGIAGDAFGGDLLATATLNSVIKTKDNLFRGNVKSS